jgi:hypothetical protein
LLTRAATEKALLAGKSPAFVEGYLGAKRETEGKTDGAPARVEAVQPTRDLVRDAEAEATYRSRNLWRGDSWLEANPYESPRREDGVDLVRDAEAETTWRWRNLWRGDSWIQKHAGAKPWR